MVDLVTYVVEGFVGVATAAIGVSLARARRRAVGAVLVVAGAFAIGHAALSLF